MAQYKRNFYGTSWYGRVQAFSGSYETHGIYTKEPLVDFVDVSAHVNLPRAIYYPGSDEYLVQKGTWKLDANLQTWTTKEAGASLQFEATGCKVDILFSSALTTAKTVEVKVDTETEGGKIPTKTFTFSAQSSAPNLSNVFSIPDLPFGMHLITISLPTTHTGEEFRFKGIKMQTSHMRFELRAKKSTGDWTPYTLLTLTEESAANGTTILKGKTPNYKDCVYVQAKIWMASSDDMTTPAIYWFQVQAGNASERSPKGQWTAVIDMKQLAQGSNLTFKEVTSIHYTADEPDGTTLWIRTSSSKDKVVFGPVTCPYKNNIKRVRLKPGRTYGYIDTPYVAPANSSVTGTLKNLVRVVKWDRWEDQSYRPPDSLETSIFYNLLDHTKNMDEPYDRFEPYARGNKTMKKPTTQDFFTRVELRRRIDKATPVVDFIHFHSLMEYNESYVKNDQIISAVHNNYTGKDMVFDMSKVVFNYPKYNPPLPGVSKVEDFDHQIIDDVKRPTDLVFYWKSQEKDFKRTHVTKDPKDQVWAEVLVKKSPTDTGVPIHHQYGGGSMIYGEPEVIEVAPTFTPRLDKGKKYRYYVTNGWPDEQYYTKQGDRIRYIAMKYGVTEEELREHNPKALYESNGMLSPGQYLSIPNKTYNPLIEIRFKSNNLFYTEKSPHNAYEDNGLDKSSDSIVVVLHRPAKEDDVDWVSEEKLFNGVVNPNDVRREYKRTYFAPDGDDVVSFFYLPQKDETWKQIAERFSIYLEDLLRANNAEADTPLSISKKILIPAPITLPRIHPKAKVSDNPYVVDIVLGSVRKKDGTPLPESAIHLVNMDVTYRRVPMTKELRVRGDVANGKDILGHPRVKKIKRVESKNGMIQYNLYDPFTKQGDFVQNGNYIDWSPASGIEPAKGEEYYVTYECDVPETVTIHMDTTYREEGGVDKVWRSPEVKHFVGICKPGEDFVMKLPNPETWKEANGVEDLQFVVEDNDLWVKTWVDKTDDGYFLKGSLQDRVPKDNWFPTLRTGYYYLGQKEFYLYSEPLTTVYGENEIPQAKRVHYETGKFGGGLLLEPASENLFKNSLFGKKTRRRHIHQVFKTT